MSKQITLDKNGKLDLVGTFEAHLILGVERSRIARFLRDNERGKTKIADPVAVPMSGPIWLRSQIEETAREMWEAAGCPGDFDEWVVERSLKRAAALPKPLPVEQLEAIIRRPLTPAQAKRFRSMPVAA